MSPIHELRDEELIRPRLKRVGKQLAYGALILGGLYLFSLRWSAFALLVPGVAVVVVAVLIARVWRILRVRHGERRRGDRRHDDRRSVEEPS